MHVLFASLELAPFSKVGGLGDVAKALPEALIAMGVPVTVLTPWYRSLPEQEPRLASTRVVGKSRVLLGDVVIPIAWRVPSDPWPGPELLFVDEPLFLSRDEPYAFGGDPGRAVQDPEGFILLAKAIQDWVIKRPRADRVVHLNEYHTALAAPLLKRFSHDPPIVLTVHNFAHHGLCAPRSFPLLGVREQDLNPGGGLEFYGQANLLKGGIWYSDMVTTVSRTYRDEALTHYNTALGLEGVLRDRAARVVGIVNGIDSKVWNPRTSPHISPHYDAKHLERKQKVKEGLVAELALPARAAQLPMAAVISRLVEQKGINLVLAIAERLLAHPATLVVLGTGRADYEQELRDLEARFPDRCRALLRFDEGLSHRIEGGADLFLMPSLFEPCGLNQMYSLAFGTVPVVRYTGGLADTVRDVRLHPDTGTGFVFLDSAAEPFWETVRAALRLWENKEVWRRIMRRAMAEVHDWETSAGEYLALYRALLDRKPPPTL